MVKSKKLSTVTQKVARSFKIVKQDTNSRVSSHTKSSTNDASSSTSDMYPPCPSDGSSIVCNVRTGFIRPHYADLQQWMNDQDNVYIGRGGVIFLNRQRFPKSGSIWANPFKVPRDGTQEKVIEKFEQYIRQKIKKENLHEELKTLRNKRLGCWCVQGHCDIHEKQIICHGQILLKILKEQETV
jgi:hypothetical protein